METINTDKLPTTETAKTEPQAKPVSVQESVMVGRLLQNTVQKLSQQGLEAINVNRAMQSIKVTFPSEFSQIQVQHRQAQIDNPLPDTTNLKPLSQQTKDSWFNGQVVAASVIKTNNDGSATVVIDKQTVDLKLPGNSSLKLEAGQRLALTVEKAPNQPATLALTHTPEQSTKLVNFVESSSNQQRALSPMLATLDAIVQRVGQISAESGQVSNNKAYPEDFVKAVRELAGQVANSRQLSNPEGLKQAVSQSGLFLENNLKITQTESIDLKQLDNLLKTSATKTGETPLSQSLQQLQTSAQQLTPRINNQVNINPELSQTLQKTFVEQQQQSTLNLKTNTTVISKPELMTVLQSLTQLAAKSEQSPALSGNGPIVEQKSPLLNKEVVTKANTEQLKQLQQAVKQLVLDTGNNTLTREQLAQINNQSTNLSELSSTLKSLANSLQGNNQALFVQSKPLVQAVSQAVIELAGEQMSKSQLAVLKQNPQSLTALSQMLKTSAQVVEALPNAESRAQVDKLIQSLNSTLSNYKSQDKTVAVQLERLTTQFNRVIPAKNDSMESRSVFPKTELSNTLKAMADTVQNINPIKQNTIKADTVRDIPPTKQNAVRTMVQSINQAVIDYGGQNISKTQLTALQQSLTSPNSMAASLRTAVQVVQALPVPDNSAAQQKLIQVVNQAISSKVVNSPQLTPLVDKLPLNQINRPEPNIAANNLSKNDISNAIKTLANSIQHAPPKQLNALQPAIQTVTQAVINYAGNNLASSQSVQLQQIPQSTQAVATQMRTAADIVQSVPIPENKAIVEKLIGLIRQAADKMAGSNQSVSNPPTSPATSNTANAEQLAALKMLRETVSQTGQQNPALTQALSKTVSEHADKLLSAQQLDRIAQNNSNPKELSLALKAVEEKVAKISNLSNEQQKQVVEKVSQILLNNGEKANLAKELSGLKTANINQSDLSLALKNIAQSIDKSTLEANPQIKRLLENLSRTITETSRTNFSTNLLQSLTLQPPKAPDIATALKTLQTLVQQTNNPTSSYPAQLLQSLSQTIATTGERILQQTALTQLRQQPGSLTELQAKFELVQKILNNPGDKSLFQPGQERINQFTHERMLQSVAQNLVQNTHNPIPSQQLNQLAKQPLAVPQLLSVLQTLNQAGGEKSNNNMFVNQMLHNINRHLTQAASQGAQLNLFNQIAQAPEQKIPELLKQLTSLAQTVEQNRPAHSNNIGLPYPKQFVQTVNQYIQQISQQFLSNNQSLTANKELSFIRSQVTNFSQQLQQISQGINQSLNSNPSQTQINQQVMQDFRVNIQRLLNVLQQIPNPTTTANPQLSPAASLGHTFPPQQMSMPGSPEAHPESGKEMPLANKTKHAQVVQAQQNPAFQLANLATFQQTFIEQLEGALARLIATQGANREQADSNVNMALEIPFRFQEKSQVLQLKMSSQDKEFDDTGGKIWTANLAFELQSLGAIRIYITLDGKDVSMQFWTEKPESQAIFQENFSLLTERLAIAGYRIAQLGSYLGVPEEASREIKRNKQGVVDEHV